MSLKGDF